MPSREKKILKNVEKGIKINRRTGKEVEICWTVIFNNFTNNNVFSITIIVRGISFCTLILLFDTISFIFIIILLLRN